MPSVDYMLQETEQRRKKRQRCNQSLSELGAADGGNVYVGGKGPIGRQGRGGVATDFLFSDDSTKSFAVVEIKTPAASIVGAHYRGRPGEGDRNETFSMHGELTGGIVQARNQIAVAIEDFLSQYWVARSVQT